MYLFFTKTFPITLAAAHEDGVDVVEDERDPVGGGLVAAAAVDADPEELAEDGHDHGKEDKAEDTPAPVDRRTLSGGQFLQQGVIYDFQG
jgi:hypothetical protein